MVAISGVAGAESLSNTFLSAPFEPGGWELALKQLARETRSARAQLIAIGGPQEIPLNWITDAPAGMAAAFAEIAGGDPAVSWRVACAGRPLHLAWERHYRAAAKKIGSGSYQDYVEQFDIPYGFQTVLLHTPNCFFGLGALRSRSDGVSGEAERTVFQRSAPHVLAAVELQRAIESQGAELVAGTLEAMDAAVFVCDRWGIVQALTPAAAAGLSEGAGLRLTNFQLSAVHAEDDRKLQRALSRVLEGSDNPQSGRFWLAGPPGTGRGRRCDVLPLPRREWTLGFEPRAIVVLRRAPRLREVHKRLLRESLHLTAAEAEVAIMAAEGKSREEIGRARKATLNTVNSQFKAIFQKAHVGREGELVALLHRILR